MKSTETTVASRARSVALEIFSSANEAELERVLDLGLPSAIFSQLGALAKPMSSRRPPLICSYSAPVANGLSGRKLLVFLDSELPEEEKVSAIAEGLFELGRSLSLWDRADLDAWIDDELRFTLIEVNSSFIEAYGDDRSMIKIGSARGTVALCSFTALKRLVLTDG